MTYTHKVHKAKTPERAATIARLLNSRPGPRHGVDGLHVTIDLHHSKTLPLGVHEAVGRTIEGIELALDDEDADTGLASQIEAGWRAPADGTVTVVTECHLGLLFDLSLDAGEVLRGDKLVKALFENAHDYMHHIVPDYRTSLYPRGPGGEPLHLDAVEIVDAYYDNVDDKRKVDVRRQPSKD